MERIKQNHEDAFSVVANLAGPELLDRLYAGIASENPVNFALFSGAMRSTVSTRHGDMVESVGEFRPGIDQPTQLNIPATLAAERPQANRLRTDVDIPRLTIVADLPERLSNTSGILSERLLGRYAVAMGLVLAERARTSASVVLADEQGATEVFNDRASEGYLAIDAVDSQNPNINNQPADNRSDIATSPLARALDIVQNDLVEQRDVVMVVSDFLAGYNHEQGTYDWEDSISRLNGSLGDRLLNLRLTSQSQRDLPVAVTQLPIEAVNRVSQDFSELANRKAAVVTKALQNTRSMEVDSDGDVVHPVVSINDFLVGE